MEYQELNYSSKNEIENLLSSDDRDDKINALVGMVNGVNDRIWVQNKLLIFVHDEDFWVAKNAITGLGDLARIYKELDILKVKAALKSVSNKSLEGVISSTFEDFDIFLNSK
jgi:hypothetical protein